MPNIKDKLREEWEHSGLQTYLLGFDGEEGEDEVLNWWLNKFDSLLKEQSSDLGRRELGKLIECAHCHPDKYKLYEGMNCSCKCHKQSKEMCIACEAKGGHKEWCTEAPSVSEKLIGKEIIVNTTSSKGLKYDWNKAASEDWEKEFDEKFTELLVANMLPSHRRLNSSPAEVKSFIKSLLQRERVDSWQKGYDAGYGDAVYESDKNKDE